MLTETQIRELAGRYGLAVLKRIQTGSHWRHFADFELTGPRAGEAWAEVRSAVPVGFRSYGPPSNPDYPDRSAYVLLSSVWCDLTDGRSEPADAGERRW